MIGLINQKKVLHAQLALDSRKGSKIIGSNSTTASTTNLKSVSSSSQRGSFGHSNLTQTKDKDKDKDKDKEKDKMEKLLKLKDEELIKTRKDLENLRSSVETSKI
jgi:hypothetical protein